MIDLGSVRIESFIETTPDAMLIVAPDGCIVAANDPARALFRCDELVGTRVDDLVPDHLRARHVQHRDRFLTAPEPRPMGAGRELQARRADGTTVPVEVSLGLIGAAELGLVSVAVRDLTDRRQAEARAATFAFVLDTTKEAVVVVDAEGTVTAWNRAAERLTGRRADDAVGAPIGELLATDDDAVTRHLASTPAPHATRDFHRARLRRADGRSTHVSLSTSTIVDAAGEVRGRSVLIRDIAEAVETQSVLADVQRTIREIQQQARVGTWAWDLATDEVQMSVALYEMLGLSPLEFDGMLSTVRDELVADEHREALIEAFDDGLDRTGSFAMDVAVDVDGSRRWMSISGEVVYDPGGEPVGYRGTVQDVTERIETVQRMQEADALKDEFLAIVSHELRTPLTSILGFGRLLRDKAADADRNFGDVLLRNADEMHGMIERILDFTRVTSGRFHVEPVRTPVADLVEEITPLLRLPMQAHDFRVDIEPDLDVIVDPNAFRRVAVNLLTNAAKFTPDGGRIDFRAHRRGDVVRFEVADEGPGIPADEREAVFSRFYQVQSNQVASRRGAGVGLAIVQTYTEAMDGRVWVESTVGEGSTFIVELPA